MTEHDLRLDMCFSYREVIGLSHCGDRYYSVFQVQSLSKKKSWNNLANFIYVIMGEKKLYLS